MVQWRFVFICLSLAKHLSADANVGDKKIIFKMNSFDLGKMAETVDNLSTCLNIMLCSKANEGGQEVLEACEQLDNVVTSFSDQINVLKEALNKERSARELSFQKQLEELKTVEERCNHMIENIPLNYCHTNENEMQQYNQQFEIKEYRTNNLNDINNLSMSSSSVWNDTYSPTVSTLSNGTLMSNTMMDRPSKSQATKQAPDIQLLKPIDNNEMDTVPKYMKGRLTSSNVNLVINGINVALENKYEILRKSRNALKKKDLDMYNTWKIQQNSVGQGQYFVTAEDITKYSETKVDKTTLNIIPILRHLKRLKESRVGGYVYYLPY